MRPPLVLTPVTVPDTTLRAHRLGGLGEREGVAVAAEDGVAASVEGADGVAGDAGFYLA